jgi:cardiolipin synthase
LTEQGPTWAAFVSSSENSIATRNDRMTQLLIATAKKRLWIANAYFVPSTPIMTLLTRKAREGVDVRVLAAGDKTDTKPYLPTQRARMDELAQAGVRTYEYVPTMLHSKTILVDDSIVVVGSSNLEPLSLNKLDDGELVAVDQRLARDAARRFLDDLARSTQRGAESKKTAGR